MNLCIILGVISFVAASVLVPVLLLVPCWSKYSLRCPATTTQGPYVQLNFQLQGECSTFQNSATLNELAAIIRSSVATQGSLPVSYVSVTSTNSSCLGTTGRKMLEGGQGIVVIKIQYPSPDVTQSTANNLALSLSTATVAGNVFTSAQLAAYLINGPPYIIPYLPYSTFSPPPSPPPGTSSSSTSTGTVMTIFNFYLSNTSTGQAPEQIFAFVPDSGDAFYTIEGLNSTQKSQLRSGQQIQIGPPPGGPPSGSAFGPKSSGPNGPAWQAGEATINVLVDSAFIPQGPEPGSGSGSGPGPGPGPGPGKRRALATVTTSSLSTLFIPISFSGCTTSSSSTYSAPSYTQASIKSAVFDGSSSYASLSSMFSQCSYGKTVLTSSNSFVAPLVTIGCSGKIYGNSWKTSACTSADYKGWADTADLEVLSKYDIDTNSYFTTVYIVPSDSACSWSTSGEILFS